MFAILVPAALCPLIVTLFWGERKAARLGLVSPPPVGDDIAPRGKRRWARRVWLFAEQLDLVGLVLLGAAVAFILLPMTLAQRAKRGWSSRACLRAFIFTRRLT